MTQPRVAVTGATGGLGRRVAAELATRGVPLRLVVRDPGRAPDLPGADVEVRRASYDDPDGLREALTGTAVVLLVSLPEQQGRAARHAAAVDAARDAGAERVVYTSFLRAAPDATFTYARDHAATEAHLRASGLGWTALRASLYVDALPGLVEDGAVRGPGGTGRLAPVARDDLAAVAAAVLATEGHQGRTYDVTGPRSLTLAEVAARIGAASGREVAYVDEDPQEARERRLATGAPAWQVEGWVTSYEAIARGELDLRSSTVRRATGRDPVEVATWLDAHPAALAHLAA